MPDADLTPAGESAVRSALDTFLAEHCWPIPDDASEVTRRFHPPEDVLDRLWQRYTGDVVPPCCVCGGELSIQSMGGGKATVYAHSTPEGVSYGEWSKHYSDSRWEMWRAGDGEVLALVALFDQLRAALHPETDQPDAEEASK